MLDPRSEKTLDIQDIKNIFRLLISKNPNIMFIVIIL